jgi:hypothetical protein
LLLLCFAEFGCWHFTSPLGDNFRKLFVRLLLYLGRDDIQTFVSEGFGHDRISFAVGPVAACAIFSKEFLTRFSVRSHNP